MKTFLKTGVYIYILLAVKERNRPVGTTQILSARVFNTNLFRRPPKR